MNNSVHNTSLLASTNERSLNPFNENFQLSVCDGPVNKFNTDPNYVACDLSKAFLQIQVLINIMIIVGVLAAIFSFTWAGWKLITGGPNEKGAAKKTFQNVGIGFLMMLTAWFVVYQLLDWLAANPGVKSLLGNP